MSIERQPDKRLALYLLKDCITSVGLKYILFFFTVAIVALVDLAPPQIYRYYFQYLHDKDDSVIIKFFFFGLSIAICSFLATGILIYGREWLRCQIEFFLRKTVLSSLFAKSLSEISLVNRGEWIATTSGDLIQTEDFLTISFPDQIKNLLMFLGTCSIFLYHGGSFGILPLVMASILILMNVAIQKKMRPALNEIRDLHSDVYQRMLENFEGLRTIRSFNGEEMVKKNFTLNLNTLNQKSLKIIKSFALLIGTNDFAILVGITSILALILFQHDLSKMAFQDAVVYPFYMGMFFMSVSSFNRSQYDWNLFFIKGTRLAKLIYDSSAKTKITDSDFYYEKKPCHRLYFKNIELKYEGHELLAEPFDLFMIQHEVLGIFGPSGCGKSTLLEFLAGLRPLRVDKDFKLLQTSLSCYVEQKPYLFAGTIAENLRFGCNAQISDEDIWEALDKSGLALFFAKKEGLNFHIFDRGQNLSEGQKYRLGITRAILSNKPFLLMDEPFAALDLTSINAIINLINHERKNRGIVIVTHYLPQALSFDRFIDLGIERTKEAPVLPQKIAIH